MWAPYYQKEGESPVICYISSTQIEGYYLNSSEVKFKKCYDSYKKCNGEGTIDNINCDNGECNDGYYIVKNKTNQCWNESLKMRWELINIFLKKIFMMNVIQDVLVVLSTKQIVLLVILLTIIIK